MPLHRPAGPVRTVEAYVTSAEQARAAEANGANRLELCGPGEGGLTPSAELLAIVLAHARIPVHAMVRPREGGFVYSDTEFAAMCRGVELAKGAGAAGVVFGMLREDGTLDAPRMGELVALARPLRVGVHRAFDATRDPDEAFEALLALGVDVVLTSGHAPTALEGVETLARLVRRAGERLTILAGGSVRAANVEAIVTASGVREVHARAIEPESFAALVQAVRRLGDRA